MRVFALLCCICNAASADQFGLFSYANNIDGTTVTITGYPTTETGAVEIPVQIYGKPVTIIGDDAFAGCQELTSVTIPEGVIGIGNRAFFNCSGLTSLTIPAGVTSLGEEAFAYCSGLTSMTVPSGVTSIANNLFEGCAVLTSVELPAAITSIGASSFYNCGLLASLTLPSTVETIGIRAFAECAKLANLTLPSSLSNMGDSAFSKCVALTSVTIPSGLHAISTSVFEDCSSLTNVIISSGVTDIGNFAFRRCTSLAAIEIPDTVTVISNSAFSRCYGLTSITVDEGNDTFSSLEGVLFDKAQTKLLTYPTGRGGVYSVPPDVTDIGASAFRFSALLTGVNIPTSVATIGADAFGSCPMLTSIMVDAANTFFSSVDGVLFNGVGNTLLAYPTGRSGAYTIPSGVTTIGTAAFRSSNLLTAVTLPVGVNTIKTDAFATCSQLASSTFLGDAPADFGVRVFQSAAGTFKIWFYHDYLDNPLDPDDLGFTTPEWKSYPAEEIGPLNAWLLSYELPIGSNLNSDANGDGVSLLMAYALDLDPSLNLSGSMPQPVLAAGQMSLSFKAGAVGVSYAVEASSDLTYWSAEGVDIVGPETLRTATVNRSGPNRFMRLVVSY